MKRALFIVLAFLATAVYAEDYVYKYLLVTDTNGNITSLSVDGLEITFSDGKFVAANGQQTASISLSELATMQFSETGSDSSDISTLISSGISQNGPVDLYSPAGIFLGTFDNASLANRKLGKGLYIVKQNNKTTKINIQ